jgi:trans-2,3-dihydro-3-hydroxyanthranilate isomerase
MKRDFSFQIVNVFVESDAATFGGNPLCVFEDARAMSDTEMQSLAAQFNLSETTFVLPRDNAPPQVRIFTPRYELPFAGHPTVGTSFVVAATHEARTRAKLDRLTLSLKAGDIDVVCEDCTWTFTANAHTSRAINASRALLAQAVGLSESDLAGEPRFVSTGTEWLVVPVNSAAALAAVKPLPNRLQQDFPNDSGRYSAYVVHRISSDRFQVRFFFPAGGGMIEDPGTGSACADLGGYLIDAGEPLPAQITVTQGEFINRLNVLRLSLTQERRVRVGGRVVEIGRGVIMLP